MEIIARQLIRLALAAGILIAPFACAASDEPEGLETFLQVLGRAPAVEAALQRVAAAELETKAAAPFPDLQLELMAQRASMPGSTWPAMGVAVIQPLPRSGERASARASAAAMRDMAASEARMVAGELAAKAAEAQARARFQRNRARIAESVLARFETALPALAARIGTPDGDSGSWTVLRARMEALRLESADARALAEDAESEIRAVLGLPVDAPVPVVPAATLPAAPGESSLAAAARSRAAVARAESAMRSSMARPMTAVRLSLEREFADMGNEDMIGLAFMTDLPFRSGRAADQRARAARRLEAAALHEARSAQSELVSLLARARRAQERNERTAASVDRTAQLLESELAVMLSRAGTGSMSSESTALRLADLADELARMRAMAAEAEADAAMVASDLWMHFPPQLNNNGLTVQISQP